MDQEDKVRLARALELSEENNQLLKKLVRHARWSRFIRIAYWLIIIGASVGVFYFFQPYIDQLISTYRSINDAVNTFNPLSGS
jgi:hypothetical protein